MSCRRSPVMLYWPVEKEPEGAEAAGADGVVRLHSRFALFKRLPRARQCASGAAKILAHQVDHLPAKQLE